MHLRVISIAMAVASVLAGRALADNLDAFNAAIEETAAHNRAAIGYLRTENVDLAAVALQDMQKSWAAFAERFGGNRPDKLRDNELYVTMLVDVPTRIVGALIMINFGRPDIASNSLQAIRREFSAVRRASGIEVLADCVLDANDAATLKMVRHHLQTIANDFAAGDFAKPEAVHDRLPDGAARMKELRAAINYQYSKIRSGGRVRITTSNAKALEAVHEFLRFQIREHKTGDSLEIISD